MHHDPYGPTRDNCTSGHIVQRGYVYRSLSGVALLLEAAHAGGYRRCQHSWLFRALLLAVYAAHRTLAAVACTRLLDLRMASGHDEDRCGHDWTHRSLSARHNGEAVLA